MHDEQLPWHEPSSATLFLLAAFELQGVGVAALRRLAAGLASALGESKNVNSHAFSEAGLREPSDSASEVARKAASELVRECAALRINILSVADREYPPCLKAINDFPPIIYVKGSIDALSAWTCVAVVGTRDASPVGETWARKIAKTLAQESVTVVSGLALGIDTCAHEGALDGGGLTVAILAHGLDTVAPTRNRQLAERILQKGGALVSEHRPGTPPRPPEFVRRNRIQSGLSVASIVVESGVEGGAIHQANFTCAQGRQLFTALPPEALRDAHGFNDEGSRFLIEVKKARPLSSQDQLKEEIVKLKELMHSPCSRGTSGGESQAIQAPLLQ